MTTTPRDTAPEAVAETLAATPSGEAPEAHLETLAVTADEVPTPAPTPTLRDGSHLPIVSREVYRIDGEIGRGGMGRVLRARDRRVGRAVAIKEALTPSRELALRFEREALITARLQHPSIIPVYECGRWPDGEPFYAMKLVAGKPLDQVIKGADDFAARAALLPHVVQVCEALAYAHDRGVIHRDLKPGNVLCGDYGETVVLDWGLAKDLATTDAPIEDAPAPTAADVTRLGSAIGTPAYMAPEQARGEEVDARADVYALGAMLYHVLAGHPPYHRSKSAQDVIEAVMASTPPVPLGEDVPRELVAIVDRAMAPSTEARYPSAGELAADLRRFEAGQVVTAHRYTLGEMVRRWIRRHRAAVLAASAIVVALGVVAVVMVRQVMQARDQARAQRAALLAESGRQELVAGAPARALPYLIEAWRAGRRDPALKVTLAEAARTVDDVERVLVHGEVGLNEVALAADGSAATFGSDNTIRVWRPDGTPGVSVDLGLDLSEPGLDFSADGALLAVSGADRAMIYDAVTGARLGPEIIDTGEAPSTPQVTLGVGRVATTLRGRARFYTVDAGRLVEQPARATPGDAVAMITRAGVPLDAVLLPATEWKRAIAELRDAQTGAVVEAIALPDVVTAWVHRDWLVTGATTDPPPSDPDGSDDRLWLVTAIELATGRRIEVRRVGFPPLRIDPLADGGFLLFDGVNLDRIDATGQLITSIDTPPRILLVGVIAAGGREAVVVIEDFAVRAYDVATGTDLGPIDGHAAATWSVNVDPDGARLITGGSDGRAVVWRFTPRVLTSGRGASAVASNGRWLRAEGTTVRGDGIELAGHTGAVVAIDAPGSSGRVATLGADHTARLWELSDGRTIATIATDADAIALAPDGRHLAARAAETITVLDDAGGEVVWLRPDDVELDGMTWSADGQRLVFWAAGGRPWVWAKGATAAKASCDSAATVVRFAPRGDLAAIGTGEGTIVLCDARTGETIARLDGRADPITQLAFSADGTTLAAVGGHTARLWSVDGRRTIVEVDHDQPIGALALRDDGTVLATVSARETSGPAPRGDRPHVSLWDARTGAPLWRRTGEGRAVTFVPGGLAVGGDELIVWALPEERRTAKDLDLALAREGRWRLDAGGLVATVVVPPPPESSVRAYEFAEDHISGGVFLPAIGPVRGADALPDQEWLLAAWDMLAAHNTAAAAAASATIDGDKLALPVERYALAYLRYLAGDSAGALRSQRAAIAAGGRDRVYTEALAVYLVQDGVGGAAAVTELRAAGAPGDQLLDLARQIADSGRDDDAAAALDAVAAMDVSIVELAHERYRIARAARRLDRAVDAWLGALAQLAPGAPDRAALLARITETAVEFHNEYRKASDPLLAEAARQLYTAVLAVPDAELLENRRAIELYSADLDRMVADGGRASVEVDGEIIRRVMRLRVREMQRCYESALVTYPALAGTVQLEFQIDRSGRTRDHVTEGLPPLVACVTTSAARWVFPSGGREIEVKIPFVFQTYDDVVTPP